MISTAIAEPVRVIDEKVIFIDPVKCTGCRSCELACAIEHSMGKSIFSLVLEKPRPHPRIRVVTVDNLLYVPMRCQHCKDAPCMNVCPTKALYRSPEGFVILDPGKCIGCLMCTLACPFGHPRYNPDTKTIVKCDFCIDRIREGRLPACVEACPTGALKYGRLEDLLAMVAEEKAKEMITGMPVPGIVYMKPVELPKPKPPTPSVSQLKSMYSPVSWR